MFCANCHLIFRESQTYSDVTPAYDPDDTIGTRWAAYHNYTVSYQDLLTTATKCHCCHEILHDSRRRLKKFLPEPETKLHVRMELMLKDYGVSNQSSMGSLHTHVHKISSEVSFEINAPESPWGHLSREMPVTGPFPADSTGSGYTAAFVRRCLEQCKSQHSRCREGSIEVHWYPTRLVEVLEDGGARVIETSETAPTGPYATLSHCWGASPMSIATTENIGRLKHYIAMPDLPRTFRDALQFIKAIGISFIWIDSLCIIQDSVKDWEFESKTMLQIYRHAECNLAAADSEDSRGGLFRERNYAILPSGWFLLDGDMLESKGPRYCCAVPFSYLKDVFENQLGSSQLMRRGWVFQERAASRRVIAFGPDQVLWDCSEALESDVVPGHQTNLYHYSDRIKSSGEFKGMAIPKKLSSGVAQSYSTLEMGLMDWQFLVQRYSACRFTFNKDKAVAMLGVAEMMSNALTAQATATSPATSTAYWAGLWLQKMYWQLTWKVARTGLRRNFHAPSWSWLSIDGPVDWDIVGNIGPDTYFGPVSALATVFGPDNKTIESDFSFRELSGELKIWCTLHHVHETEKYYDHLDHEDIEAGNSHFLPLFCVLEGSGLKCVTGIIVQPAEDQPGRYRRCGAGALYPSKYDEYIEVTPNTSLSEKRERIGRILKQLEETSSDLYFEYEEYDPELGYLVCVV